MSSSSALRRSPRLVERERHEAAKASDAARKASCVPAGPPNTFVSTTAPAAPVPAAAPARFPGEDAMIAEIKKRIASVDAMYSKEAKCVEATLLMNYLNLNALPLLKKHSKFCNVVIAKCREFYNDPTASADLKESCAALLAAIAAMSPAPAPPTPSAAPAPTPAPTPAPAPTPSQIAAFSAPTDEDCAYFASCIRQPTFEMYIPPRPAARDTNTAVKHIDLLLKLTEHAAVGTLVPHTELFEYILVTAPVVLLTHKAFRETVADKVKEFARDMKARRVTHEPLTRVMATLSEMIRSADAV